jgi:hypothetical protein
VGGIGDAVAIDVVVREVNELSLSVVAGDGLRGLTYLSNDYLEKESRRNGILMLMVDGAVVPVLVI